MQNVPAVWSYQFNDWDHTNGFVGLYAILTTATHAF